MHTVKIGWSPSYKKTEYKLFCTCGFQNKIDETTDECPACGKQIDVIINDKKGYIGTLENLSETDEEYKAAFTATEFTKKTKGEYDKEPVGFTKRKNKFELSFIKETAKLVLKHKNATAQLGDTIPLSMASAIQVIQKCDTLDSFLNDCLRKRGVKYRSISDFRYPDGMKQTEFLAHLEYPNLQNMPWEYYRFPFNEETAEKVNRSDTATKMVDTFLNNPPKSIRKLALSSGQKFNFLCTWYPYIERVENLRKFLEHFNNSYSQNVFDRESNPLFHIGLETLKNFHQEETLLVNRILKMAKEQDFKHLAQIVSFIEDIGRMMKKLKSKLKKFDPEFNGSIVNFHDMLTIEIANLDLKKVDYDFSIDEEKMEESDGKFSFKLAKNSKELLEIGKKMHHCVGSYHDAAVSKRCTIVVLKEENNPVVCMELRGKSLVQAKMKYNQRPTNDLKIKIENWARKHKIKTISCHDIA